MTNILAQSARSSSRGAVVMKVNSSCSKRSRRSLLVHLIASNPENTTAERKRRSWLAPSPFRPLVAPNSCLEATIHQLECVLLHPYANQMGTAIRLSTHTHISAHETSPRCRSEAGDPTSFGPYLRPLKLCHFPMAHLIQLSSVTSEAEEWVAAVNACTARHVPSGL